jgi:hypothetical protein
VRAVSPNESGGDPIGCRRRYKLVRYLSPRHAARKFPLAKAVRSIAQTALRFVADDLPVRLSAVSSKLIF